MGAVLTLAVKILQKGVDVKDLQVNSLESRDYTRVSIICMISEINVCKNWKKAPQFLLATW